MSVKEKKDLQEVTIRFAGDSGDGMQVTGTQFTNTSAVFGNDISTLPDFPAEIRAPAGSLPGVSGFQLHFSSRDIRTPGDEPNVLVAMNPAALTCQSCGSRIRRDPDRKFGRIFCEQFEESRLYRESNRRWKPFRLSIIFFADYQSECECANRNNAREKRNRSMQEFLCPWNFVLALRSSNESHFGLDRYAFQKVAGNRKGECAFFESWILLWRNDRTFHNTLSR